MNLKKVTVILVLIFIFIILLICNYKKINFGNNIISKSTEDIATDILNTKSYTAVINVIVNSNKNTNEYKLKQEWKDGKFTQEVIDNEEIGKVKIEFDGNNLSIKNANLNLEKIYENYEWVANNYLFLNTFIEDYKNSNDSKCYEEKNYIILETSVTNVKNKYIYTKKIYVKKESGKIEKMELLDSKQKGTIYILYNEIELSK